MKWANSLKDAICQHSAQKERNNLNRFLYVKEIEPVINLLKQKIPGTDSFNYEFYKTLMENIPILYSLIWKINAEGISPNSFYEDSITLI